MSEHEATHYVMNNSLRMGDDRRFWVNLSYVPN